MSSEYANAGGGVAKVFVAATSPDWKQLTPDLKDVHFQITDRAGTPVSIVRVRPGPLLDHRSGVNATVEDGTVVLSRPDGRGLVDVDDYTGDQLLLCSIRFRGTTDLSVNGELCMENGVAHGHSTGDLPLRYELRSFCTPFTR
jgi:hypothetical protein